MALDPRQAIASFISKGNSAISEKGGIAYDNPKQNIDPNILTKVLTAKEIVIADHGSVQYLKSGMLFISGSNLFIANSPTSITQLGAGGTSSGDVATDTIWDAKGDVAVGTGADTASRLAVGVTSGMVLSVDDSTATGLIWKTATGAVDSVFTRTGDVVAATNDYTWAQVNKATSSIADITTRSHTSLTDIGTNTHAA